MQSTTFDYNVCFLLCTFGRGYELGNRAPYMHYKGLRQQPGIMMYYPRCDLQNLKQSCKTPVKQELTAKSHKHGLICEDMLSFPYILTLSFSLN